MGLIEIKKLFYVRSSNPKEDNQRIKDKMYLTFRDLFSKVSVGSNSLAFSKSTFSLFFVWRFSEFITEAEIRIEEESNYLRIEAKISFLRFLKLYSMIGIFISMLAIFSREWLFVLIAPLLFTSMLIIYSQVGAMNFYSLLRKCLQEDGYEPE